MENKTCIRLRATAVVEDAAWLSDVGVGTSVTATMLQGFDVFDAGVLAIVRDGGGMSNITISMQDYERWCATCPQCTELCQKHPIEGSTTSLYTGECGHNWIVDERGKRELGTRHG